MNWEAIGAIGEVGGAIAVVVTLAYLARQIRDSAQATSIAAYHQAQEQTWSVGAAVEASRLPQIHYDKLIQVAGPEDEVPDLARGILREGAADHVPRIRAGDLPALGQIVEFGRHGSDARPLLQRGQIDRSRRQDFPTILGQIEVAASVAGPPAGSAGAPSSPNLADVGEPSATRTMATSRRSLLGHGHDAPVR